MYDSNNYKWNFMVCISGCIAAQDEDALSYYRMRG